MKTFDPLRSIHCLLAPVGLATTLGCGPTAPTLPEEPCKGIAPGDVVLSEFMADPAGSDTGRQYIEIYNTTDHTLNLSGLTLFQSMSDGSRGNATALPSLAVSSHGYFVLGDAGNDAATRPAYLNYGYGSNLGALRHENGKLGLHCGSAIIAEVAYTEVSAGRARQLDGLSAPNAAQIPDASKWCDATLPLNALAPVGENYGSPGTPNPPCSTGNQGATDAGLNGSHLVGAGGSSAIIQTDAGIASIGCVDPVSGSRRAINKPQTGDLVITEVMPAPSVNNNGPGEWFEVLATRAVDLNQIELANEGSASTLLTSESCLGVAAGSWLLFTRSRDSAQNGGLPSTAAIFDFTLADSGSATYAERAVTLRLEGNIIDRASWLKTTKGTSLQRSASSLGSNAEAKWCLSAGELTFGAGDHGTPGAANWACASLLVDAGVTSIDEINAGIGGTTTSSDTGTPFAADSSDAGVGGTTHVTGAGGVSHYLGAGGTTRSSSTGGASYNLGAGGTSATASTGGASYNLGAGGTSATASTGGASYSLGAGGTTATTSAGSTAHDTGGGGGFTSQLAGTGGVLWASDSGGASPVQAGAGGAIAVADASAGNQCRDADGTRRTPVAPQVGDLTVTEFMAAPSTNNNGAAEWFEVLVNHELDLNGLEITNESSGRVSLLSDTCLHVQAGDRLVFARSADSAQNGGLPFVSATFAFTLADSGTTAHPERTLVLRASNVELDRVTWTKSTKGASWQQAESVLGTNDTGDGGTDGGKELDLWCVTPALVTFGLGDRGTPGSTNGTCE